MQVHRQVTQSCQTPCHSLGRRLAQQQTHLPVLAPSRSGKWRTSPVTPPQVATPTSTVATAKQPKTDIEGPSTDLSVIYERLKRVSRLSIVCPRSAMNAAPQAGHELSTAVPTPTLNTSPCWLTSCAPAVACSLCCRTGWRCPQLGGGWLVWWGSH